MAGGGACGPGRRCRRRGCAARADGGKERSLGARTAALASDWRRPTAVRVSPSSSPSAGRAYPSTPFAAEVGEAACPGGRRAGAGQGGGGSCHGPGQVVRGGPRGRVIALSKVVDRGWRARGALLKRAERVARRITARPRPLPKRGAPQQPNRGGSRGGAGVEQVGRPRRRGHGRLPTAVPSRGVGGGKLAKGRLLRAAGEGGRGGGRRILAYANRAASRRSGSFGEASRGVGGREGRG